MSDDIVSLRMREAKAKVDVDDGALAVRLARAHIEQETIDCDCNGDPKQLGSTERDRERKLDLIVAAQPNYRALLASLRAAQAALAIASAEVEAHHEALRHESTGALQAYADAIAQSGLYPGARPFAEVAR